MSAVLPIAASRTASGGHHSSSSGAQHKPRSDPSSDDEPATAMTPLKGGSVRSAISTAQVSLPAVLRQWRQCPV